jgi:hypothetical protein
MKLPPPPRSSKMVNAESRTSDFATSIAALLFMSANAPRFDAVAASAVRLDDVSENRAFSRCPPEPAHAVLLPVCRLHHFFDAGPWVGSAG